MRALREQIEQVKIEMEQAEREYDLNKAAELKYGKLRELENATASRIRRVSPKQGGTRADQRRGGRRRHRRSGQPLDRHPGSKLIEGEMQKLLHLEDELHQRVIGQDEAVRRWRKR